MQVSQMSDAVTHAVIGQEESISMGVSDSAALMHILSSTLYTFPKLAMVRETLCNGWDAHISAGITDKPLDISFEGNRLIIRDYGFGIPHAKIGEIYGVYGNSTKRDDSTTTGGFGLGSKAPFAYTDNFEVTSCNEGTKSIYRISKSSMERGGKPAINTIVKLPTVESGITVSIEIDPDHHNEFHKLILEVVQLGEIKINLNGELVELSYPLEASPTGYIIHHYMGTIGGRINLRYGNVVYPIPRHESYAGRFDTLLNLIDNLRDKANITFMAPADSISIAPSREAIILTDKTVSTVSDLLGMFDANSDIAKAKTSSRMIARAMVNQRIEAESCDELIKGINRDTTWYFHDVSPKIGLFSYTMRKATLQTALCRRDQLLSTRKTQIKRTKELIRKGFLPKKAGKELVGKMIEIDNRNGIHKRCWGQNDLTGWVHKYVGGPILQTMLKTKRMSKHKLLFVQHDYQHSYSLTKYCGMQVDTPNTAIKIAGKRVLLTTSKAIAEEWLSKELASYTRGGHLVYILTSRKPEAVDEARELFSSLGYTVTEYFPEKEVEMVEVIEADGTVIEVPKKAYKKRKGFLTLASSLTKEPRISSSFFLLNTARENCTADESLLVTDPIAYVILNNKSEGAQCFHHLAEEKCVSINHLWGDKIAVVTSLQVGKLKEAGVPEIREFIKGYVDDALSKRPDFPRYLAFGKFFQEKSYRSNEATLLRYACNNENVMKKLGLRFYLSAETEALLTFYTDRYSAGNTEMTKCTALAVKVKESPMVQVMRNRARASPWYDFINMDYLAGLLRVGAGMAHPEKMLVAEEITINLLKEANQ